MNSEKAVEEFERAVKLNPKFVLSNVQCCYAQYLHAKQMSNEHDADKYLRRLKEFVIKYPDHAESYTLYAQVIIVVLNFKIWNQPFNFNNLKLIFMFKI